MKIRRCLASSWRRWKPMSGYISVLFIGAVVLNIYLFKLHADQGRSDGIYVNIQKTTAECPVIRLPVGLIESYKARFQNVSNAGTLVYSAYFDERLPRSRTVRILALSTPGPKTLYCIFWYRDGRRVSVLAKVQNLYQRQHSTTSAYKHFPTIFQCPEYSGLPPAVVSLATRSCADDVKNHVLIYTISANMKPTGQKLGICHNTLQSVMNPHAVVEWLEMQRLLGVSQVTFYGVKDVSDDVINVLSYYKAKHFVKIQPWSLPWPSTREPLEGPPEIHEYAEQIMVNDCIYRYMDTFKYLAFLDFDEYIIPHHEGSQTIQDILSYINKNVPRSYASYMFGHSHFCLEKSHLQSKKNSFVGLEILSRNGINWSLSKSVVVPWNIKVMGIRHPLVTLPNKVSNVTVRNTLGLLHHYRERRYPSIEKVKVPPCTITDTSMLKFTDDLIRTSNKVLFDNGLSYRRLIEHHSRILRASKKLDLRYDPLVEGIRDKFHSRRKKLKEMIKQKPMKKVGGKDHVEKVAAHLGKIRKEYEEKMKRLTRLLEQGKKTESRLTALGKIVVVESEKRGESEATRAGSDANPSHMNATSKSMLINDETNNVTSETEFGSDDSVENQPDGGPGYSSEFGVDKNIENPLNSEEKLQSTTDNENGVRYESDDPYQYDEMHTEEIDDVTPETEGDGT